LIKDADVLLDIMEQIALELDIKIQLKINVNTFQPDDNYYLNSEKSIFEHPFYC